MVNLEKYEKEVFKKIQESGPAPKRLYFNKGLWTTTVLSETAHTSYVLHAIHLRSYVFL